MAGLCAAIASARNGAKTAIIQDRPVFGGNASSEIRMWICGSQGAHCHEVGNKETGILEEIQLENQYRNPTGNYSLWDSVLWSKAVFQPNLTTFLNCSCTDAEMDGSQIVAIKAWQLTSQTWHTIYSKLFVDCSGDSILAPVTGADFRMGREARAEFNEDIEPFEADRKTMGNTALIQMRRTDEEQKFIAPSWAYRFNDPSDLPHRINGVNGHNFWWMEVGGLKDTIRDAESIAMECQRISYGVVDYMKNRAPQRSEAANWAVEWMGSLPGKRESRRYIGDHVLTQNEVTAGGQFDDVIAYGGWFMDDHHPAGIYFPGEPTVYHSAPSVYGIPYRSLYSRNVSNLLFAGRNISVTHAALSSTRVMGTCAILGQAVGTAAALCAKQSCKPRDLSSGDGLRKLQRTVMEDDCWLPGVQREISELARAGCLTGCGEGSSLLLDGVERDRKSESHSWTAPLGASLEFQWPQRVKIDGARLVFDTDLNKDKPMPCTYPRSIDGQKMPAALIKAFRLEVQDETGSWRTVFSEKNNYQRLVYVPLATEGRGLRFVGEETWGDPIARLFAFEPLSHCESKFPAFPEGETFTELRSRISSKDLEPPANLGGPHPVW